LSLIALLARLGTSDPVEPVDSVTPLIAGVDFARFGRAPARFDEAELAQLNARIIHRLDYDVVADRLPAGIGAEGWDAIRPNLTRVDAAADLWAIVEGPVTAEIAPEDRAFLEEAAVAAEALDWSADPWHALTNQMKEASGRKGKALFLPLRLALTAREHGPDMAALLPLIGKDRAIARLRQAASLG
jgi:glutamyl-tRNA synthetase